MSYTRELVESLLPAVWFEDYAFGMEAPHAPDPDMPSGYVNPAHGNTLSAHLTDIRDGYRRANLTLKERRTLFLRFAMDWQQVDIGIHEGVGKSAISERLFIAVGKVTAEINGIDFKEFLEDSAPQERELLV